MKISVIVPVYNSDKNLRTCLDSLINQTLTDIEIIIIDDASTDKSLEIIKDFACKFPNKIKVILNEKNIGAGASRNRGMDIASGEYIGFVDSDDYVAPKHFEILYKNAKVNHFTEISICGYMFTHGDNLKYKQQSNSDIECTDISTSLSIILRQSPAVWDKLFRADFIKNKKFLENRIWEDIAFSYGALFQAQKIVETLNISYFYRQNPKGITASCSKINPKLLDIFAVLDDLERKLNERSDFEKFISVLKKIQVKYSFCRIHDIKKWDIPIEKKRRLMVLLANLIATKYDGERRKRAFLQANLELQAGGYCPPVKYDIDESETMSEIEEMLWTLKK